MPENTGKYRKMPENTPKKEPERPENGVLVAPKMMRKPTLSIRDEAELRRQKLDPLLRCRTYLHAHLPL